MWPGVSPPHSAPASQKNEKERNLGLTEDTKKRKTQTKKKGKIKALKSDISKDESEFLEDPDVVGWVGGYFFAFLGLTAGARKCGMGCISVSIQ